MGDFADFIGCIVHVPDGSWRVKLSRGDIEVLDYGRGYEIVGCATVDQGVDFGN
jgi:hypothetical protein